MGEAKKFKSKGKGKGKKGKKGKGKGKAQEEDEEGPAAKKQKLGEGGDEEKEEGDGFDFEGEWKDKQICLVGLKTAALNGSYGFVKEYLGAEEVLIEGKKKLIRRFKVDLEAGKGEKSIKFENLFKVMTGALVKLRGLDQTELNDSIAECGRLDAGTMRYDVTLSDGRHIKVKPANAEFYAKFNTTQVAGDREQMDWMKDCNSLTDRLWVIEECEYPVPLLLPASALQEYGKKFPKSVVIGRSNAMNPKGVPLLQKEVTSATRVAPSARIVFVSMPRDRSCVGPPLADTRHDELIRLGKFAGWLAKRCEPRAVYFVLPGLVAKGPPSSLAAATCAWPLYVSLCTDVVCLDSERWKKSAWTRLDALLAVWARRPLYLLPEKYAPPIELGDVGGPQSAGADDEDAQEAAKSTPLTFRQEEPLTISRPTEGLGTVPPLLKALEGRAAEAETSGGAAKVQCPTLAARRLG